MQVIGPAGWESTRKLTEALHGLESNKVLRYGTGPRVDGYEQLVRFRDAGLPVPFVTTKIIKPHGTSAQSGGVEIWGRLFKHSHGSDIISTRESRFHWIRPPISKWSCRDFWVQMIPSQREFRQHIFNGRAIRVGEKICTSPAWRKLPVRSRSNGWTLKYPPNEPVPEGIRELAKKAIGTLGYLMGAVDIIQGQDNRLYVLEVNSAPSLRDPQTLATYIKEITRWVKQQ